MDQNAGRPVLTGHCPECGALVPGGRAGCQALYDEISFQAASNPRIAAVHRLAFDAYCMQHVETYCQSAKSYAAHLTGLCCGTEHRGDPAVYAAIPRWLNGKVELNKPAILSLRGTMTITDVTADRVIEAEILRIHDWANIVWQAYGSQHEIARAWLKIALSQKAVRR